MDIRATSMIFICLVKYTIIHSELIVNSHDLEKEKIDIIAEIIVRNLKYNGWNNILLMGRLPDHLHHNLKNIPFTFTVSDIDIYDAQIDNVVPYHSNIIVMSCRNIEEFENAMKKIVTLPYWHPLANIILNYNATYNKEITAKLFYIYWYYRAINVVIIQYNIDNDMIISNYNPFITENYKLDNVFGCWTTRKIDMPIKSFDKSFLCDTECHNVTSYSKLRAFHLGTCLGFDTHIISIKDLDQIKYLNLFEDKGNNLHGFTFYAYTVECVPFFIINENENGSYTFHQRDGMIWNTMAELLNFTIDISPALKEIKKTFNFEVQMKQVFSFYQRKADFILYPVYLQELYIEVDYTIPYVDSGVCILSHRAGFETLVFDVTFVEKNLYVIIELFIGIFCTWFVFFIYNAKVIGKASLDQAGKDFISTIKTVLSITLHKPPERSLFRIFFIIMVFSFFVVNYNIQATTISLFSVHMKNKEVDTFEDIIEKGYSIEGITSPDVVLPDSEEKYRIISSRIKSVTDLFGCVKQMENDSQRFCLIDCVIGSYLVRNMMNKKRHQFLHLASNARIHSHYLNMILHKNSPLTENFNRYIMKLFEAGIIKKWMEFKDFYFKEDTTTKPLGYGDVEGIFQLYIFLVGITFFVFIFEVFLGFIHWLSFKRKCGNNVNNNDVFRA